jgi:hypothetical protein
MRQYDISKSLNDLDRRIRLLEATIKGNKPIDFVEPKPASTETPIKPAPEPRIGTTSLGTIANLPKKEEAHREFSTLVDPLDTNLSDRGLKMKYGQNWKNAKSQLQSVKEEAAIEAESKTEDAAN